jgi:transcriptional regulator with XRE-family HTH domain
MYTIMRLSTDFVFLRIPLRKLAYRIKEGEPMPPVIRAFPNVIKLRDTLGLSQQALADLAGLGRNVVANLENGRRVDVDVALGAIAEAVHCTKESLALEEGPLLDCTNEPYTKDTFLDPPWPILGSDYDSEEKFRRGIRILERLQNKAFRGAYKKFTPGRAGAFLGRLERWLNEEASRLKVEATDLEPVLKESFKVKARDLAIELTDRILPDKGILTVMLYLRFSQPLRLMEESEESFAIIQDKEDKRLEFALTPGELSCILAMPNKTPINR